MARFFKGGTSRARAAFEDFIHNKFQRYVENRNQPQTDDISHMSPYLHFGQISPLYLALSVLANMDRLTEAQDAYLEELIIRRELAMNFVYYTPNYDAFACLPQWAPGILAAAPEGSPREHLYP